jgi:hypothetical protein
VEVFGFGEFEGRTGAIYGLDAILLVFVNFMNKKSQMGRVGKEILPMKRRIRGEREG